MSGIRIEKAMDYGGTLAAYKITIDGKDISHLINEITVRLKAGKLTTAEILFIDDVFIDSDAIIIENDILLWRTIFRKQIENVVHNYIMENGLIYPMSETESSKLSMLSRLEKVLLRAINNELMFVLSVFALEGKLLDFDEWGNAVINETIKKSTVTGIHQLGERTYTMLLDVLRQRNLTPPQK